MAQVARIVVADDHPDMLDELCELLAPTFEVVDAVGDGIALVAATQRTNPDVIVADLAMPVMGGLAAARLILQDRPDARIVFVTALTDPAITERCLELGALGWVSKIVAGSELVPVVLAALRGERRVALHRAAPG